MNEAFDKIKKKKHFYLYFYLTNLYFPKHIRLRINKSLFFSLVYILDIAEAKKKRI